MVVLSQLHLRIEIPIQPDKLKIVQMPEREAVYKNLDLYGKINQIILEVGNKTEHLQLLEQAQNVLYRWFNFINSILSET